MGPAVARRGSDFENLGFDGRLARFASAVGAFLDAAHGLLHLGQLELDAGEGGEVGLPLDVVEAEVELSRPRSTQVHVVGLVGVAGVIDVIDVIDVALARLVGVVDSLRLIPLIRLIHCPEIVPATCVRLVGAEVWGGSHLRRRQTEAAAAGA